MNRSELLEAGIVVALSLALALVYMHPIIGRWHNEGEHEVQVY